jgi:hypothetical protein
MRKATTSFTVMLIGLVRGIIADRTTYAPQRERV